LGNTKVCQNQKEKKMAKKLWLGMLIAALAFRMMLIGCDNSTGAGRGGNDIDPALVGTWICCCGEGTMVLNTLSQCFSSKRPAQ